MSTVDKFKERYKWARQYQPWFPSFVYALNGWMLWLWYGMFAVVGWNLFDWLGIPK